ncbi:MAG: hypothetical protein ACPF9S_02445, partial [Candidatus Poseidoniaceae archaeon]
CFVHSDPTCVLAGGRVEDGSFDPDDGHQHGTACMGMAAATGLDANGEQTDFYGAAPDAALVDVRIGTDAGAGPFENYLLSQEFYESCNGSLTTRTMPGRVPMKASMASTSSHFHGESHPTKEAAQMVLICTVAFSMKP